MNLDIQSILSTVVPMIGALAWVYSRLDKKFDAIDKKFDAIDKKIDKLDEKLTDVDRRLCRLEGAFSAKECCVIKSENHLKKAE